MASLLTGFYLFNYLNKILKTVLKYMLSKTVKCLWVYPSYTVYVRNMNLGQSKEFNILIAQLIVKVTLQYMFSHSGNLEDQYHENQMDKFPSLMVGSLHR